MNFYHFTSLAMADFSDALALASRLLLFVELPFGFRLHHCALQMMHGFLSCPTPSSFSSNPQMLTNITLIMK
jgi:hypothetical protein